MQIVDSRHTKNPMAPNYDTKNKTQHAKHHWEIKGRL